MTTNRRALANRIEELEAEVRRRRWTSEVQAEYAIDNDNRDEKAEDERPDEELSASERQVRALTKRRGRAGRGWKKVTP